MAISINNENFEKEVTNATKPVIIDIYAPWCPPCQYMAPIFHELEEEMGANYIFAKLNVDEAREISIKYGVSSIPTFIFIKNNTVKGRETGAMSKEELKEKIEKLLA